MKLVRIIETPWTPYTVLFSNDGTRLVSGGGSWYGFGGILITDLASGHKESLSFQLDQNAKASQPPWGAVSGICLSVDDRFLAASTWSPGHCHGPTLLYEIKGNSLYLAETLEKKPLSESVDCCPTGIIIDSDRIVVRNHTSEPRDVIHSWKKEGLKSPFLSNLSSHRMVVHGEYVIAGCQKALHLPDRPRATGSESIGHLIQQRLDDERSQGFRVIPVSDSRAITALTTGITENSFFTGGIDGEIDLWEGMTPHQKTRLRDRYRKKKPVHSKVPWAVFEPASVVGMCRLNSNQSWISIDAVGELTLWQNDQEAESWKLPISGSPRSIAAHPDPERSWIAVAIKSEMTLHEGSCVAIFELIH